MNTLCLKLLPLWILLLLTGCNSDLFIDEVDFPEDSRTVVAPGESASFSFPTDGLREVKAMFFGAAYDCVKYLPSGDVFATYKDAKEMSLFDIRTSQPFIARLTAENSDVSFEITGSETGWIELRSIENLLGEDALCVVRLSYTYGREFQITFVMKSSLDEPPVLKVKELIYDTSIQTKTWSTHFEQNVLLNFTDHPVPSTYSVENLCRTIVTFQFSDLNYDESKIVFGDYKALIPTFSGAERRASFFDCRVPLKTGNQFVEPDDASLVTADSFYKVYDVSVPAMMMVTAYLDVDNILISTSATLVTENTVTGLEKRFVMNVHVSQAFGYKIEFKDEKFNYSYDDGN